MTDLNALLHQEDNFTKLYSISPVQIQQNTFLTENLILLEETLMLAMHKEDLFLQRLHSKEHWWDKIRA